MSDVRTIRLREATREDAAGIARVRGEGWRTAYAGIIAAEILDAIDESADTARFAGRIGTEPDVHLLVAELDGEVVGFCTYGPDRDEPSSGRGEIYALYVSPGVWRSGAGTILIQAAVSDCRDRGITEIRLWTLTDNSQARDFYARRGFLADGTERGVPGLLGTDGQDAREVRYVRHAEG
jgi:ribosomal protein S18 acetylase RimI-like enzyme